MHWVMSSSHTVCRETVLPAGRIQGERDRTSGQLRLFAKVLRCGDFYGARIDRALPDRQPLPRPDDLRQYRIALGPKVFKADVSLLLKGDEWLQEEVFGPTTIVIEVEDRAQLAAALHGLRGN